MRRKYTFHITDPSWGESTDHQWMPQQGAGNAELGYFFVVSVIVNKLLNKQFNTW